MKLPLQSIKEYTQCNLELENILRIISSKIGSVEGYTDLSVMYEGIYVGEILEVKEHPNADKLGIYTINIGEEENIQVVAGDKHLEVGDRVAYIKPGNIVPSTYGSSEEFKIKAVNMRGVTSNGMLCSEKELNLGPDHSKVLVLDEDAVVGIPFSQYYKLDDVVIDIENKALTNRGDLFGILGLAREIAAAQQIPFKSPDWYTKDSVDINVKSESLPIEVLNEVSSLCPRYVCVSMDNVEIKQSPVWLKSLLIKSGIKPINTIVDITNYLAIVTGQPLHAFDYDKLVSNDQNGKDMAHITIRLARDGERIHTLDGSLVELNSNNMVIADSTNPIAIAGVVGGMDTQIDMNTKRIIIESANFNRFSIRKTSMDLGIFTEAVTRYTKGQHPGLCLPILLKAISLVQELSNGVISCDIKDIYSEPVLQKGISFSIYKLNSHLGTNLSKDDITQILSNIEYVVEKGETESEYITVTPPLCRTDIYIPEDIYEDVGRIYGYENILSKLPTREIKASLKNDTLSLKSKIRNILSNSGCNEIDTYSFTSSKDILNSNQDPNLAYHIKNALSPDLEFMRTSLLTSMFSKAQYNVQQNISPFCIYEFNIPHIKGYIDNFNLPKEDWHLALLFSSKENILEDNPYYQVERYLEKILTTLGIGSLEYTLLSDSSEIDIPIWIKNLIPSFNSNSSVLIQYKKEGNTYTLGIMGDVNIQVKNNYKLPTYTSCFEINIEILKKLGPNKSTSTKSSKYPSITQDVCLTVDTNMQYKELEDTVLKNVNSKDRDGFVECIDIYQKEKDTKNITLRIRIEHSKKTLTDKEFKKIQERIEEGIKKLQTQKD